jgi:hypothetical protein
MYVPADRLTPTVKWLPSSLGGIILMLSLALAISWWLTGRFFKARDTTTLAFRGLTSLLICFALGLFDRSLVSFFHEGSLAAVFETRADREQRLRDKMQEWVTPAACDAYWNTIPADSRKTWQMSPAERKEFAANQVNPEILVESAIRGLAWMALEHRQPSPVGRNEFPHTERGTKVLNNFTAAQAQLMFDYIVWVSPNSEREARPYLADALAYCRETPSAAAAAARQEGPAAVHAGRPPARPYPHIEVVRETEQGRVFVVRMSATETRIVKAGSEEEALKKAKQP